MDDTRGKGYYFAGDAEKAIPSCMIGAIWRVRHSLDIKCRFKHPCWVLDYSLGRGVRYRVGKGAWKERDQEVGHLYPPDTPYWGDTTRSIPPDQCFFILFKGGERIGLMDFIRPGESYAKFLDPDGVLKSYLWESVNTCHQLGDKGFWAAQSIFYSIVDLLHRKACHLENETYVIRKTEKTSRPFEDNVRNYMKNNIGKNITLNDIAKHVNVSISTLSHKYFIETGESPRRTLAKMRVNMAQGLLLKDERLKNIATQIGFYDEYHLSKSFKRITGLSPRQFVKRLRSY